MGITRKASLLRRIFGSDLSEIMDHHLMEIYQMDLPSLNELKTFWPAEYRRMKDEELGFWERNRS